MLLQVLSKRKQFKGERMDDIYHFIGIGGIGMSALARILLDKGVSVSGSDIASSPSLNLLAERGATIYVGHDKDHVPAQGYVIYSTDIKEDNAELLEAKRRQLPLLHRSELLGMVLRGQKALLVTGTHGKTTTSSLLSHILEDMLFDPSYAIGGIIKDKGINGRYGQGEYFVAEADESDKSFLAYSGYGAIITNIDLDHLNYWDTEEKLILGFKQFADSIENKDLLVFCGDDQRLCSLGLKGISYGFSEHVSARITRFYQHGLTLCFDLFFHGTSYTNIEVPLIGRHNALNTAAVFVMALMLGASETKIRKALLTFAGVKRRADLIGNASGVRFYDDYGHHPTEVEATIGAFKQSFPDRRLVTIFQPHRYTRTRDCFNAFTDAFNASDVLILTDLYAAGEEPIEGISSEALFRRIIEEKSSQTYYIRKDALQNFLSHFLQDGDVVLTMGAGDVTKLGPLMLQSMQAKV